MTTDAASLLPRCRFPEPGSVVTCAVSGGADSTALLILAVEAGLVATAMHIDHGRRDASGEIEVVRNNAARLGVPFRCERAAVEDGSNLEERMRVARRALLPRDALLGHTADDQAETLLLNLMRGTGLHGLGGMRVDDARRPLLSLRRDETRGLCRDLGFRVVHDPTNDDPSIRRNRVRHELLPLLDDIADRDVVPLLCRLADVAREAGDRLDDEAAMVDVEDVRELLGAPPVIARLAVRLWLRQCDEHRHPPDAATIERVLAVARHELGATDVGGGWQIRRTAGRLRLEPGPATHD